MRALKLSYFLLLLPLLAWSGAAWTQDIPTSRKNIQLRLVDLPGTAVQGKQLYTVVDGKQYPIDRLLAQAGVARLDGYSANSGFASWYLDPKGESLYYMALTGCGFESDGMALFRSDLFGKKIEPVLGRCDNLKMETLSPGDKNYLLVREGNSGVGDTGFWIFDLASNEPLVHAAGTLSAGKGNFHYCNGNEEEKGTCYDVSADVLLNRKTPVKLLPRFPLTARTLADGVELRQEEGGLACGKSPSTTVAKIPQKGSQVLVLDSCKGRGVYEVFYRGARGTVSQNYLQGINIPSEVSQAPVNSPK